MVRHILPRHVSKGGVNLCVALCLWAMPVTAVAGCDAGGSEKGPPEARFSYTSASGSTPVIRFDASASRDPDGTITSYEWTFENDRTATGATVTHSFADRPRYRYGIDHSYEVTLTVTDDRGAERGTTRTVALPGRTEDTPWKLVWCDEFEEDGRPAAAKWRYETGGGGWGNQEKQTYTRKRQNARVEEGHLIIEVRKEGSSYTSARLNSEVSWTYGRFEIRAKLPSGRGTWPAIWMLASQDRYGAQYWPHNGEIDIMEHVGYEPGVVHASIHTEAFNHTENTQRTSEVRVPDAPSEFKVYAMEWTPEEIRAFVDGERYFTFKNRASYTWREWPFDQDFHLLLNIAVGGTWGGAEGIDPSIFPQQMVVDYVRVYQPE